MATNYKDIPTQDWAMSLNKSGEVVTDLEDIAQCILIILNTRKGSNALRPEFGTEIWKYVDKPVNFAIPNVKREILQAIALYEPRATITAITEEVIVSQVIFTIDFTFATTGLSQTVNFTLTLA